MPRPTWRRLTPRSNPNSRDNRPRSFRQPRAARAPRPHRRARAVRRVPDSQPRPLRLARQPRPRDPRVRASLVRCVGRVHRLPWRNADAASGAGNLRSVLLAPGRPTCGHGRALVGRPEPLEHLRLRAGRPRPRAAARWRRRARLELPPRGPRTPRPGPAHRRRRTVGRRAGVRVVLPARMDLRWRATRVGVTANVCSTKPIAAWVLDAGYPLSYLPLAGVLLSVWR